MLVGSANRWALMHELRGAPEPSLDELLGRLSPCDLVLVEGWKQAMIPKIEVHRSACPAPLLAATDPWVVAVATDLARLPVSVPQVHVDDIPAIAAVVFARFSRSSV